MDDDRITEWAAQLHALRARVKALTELADRYAALLREALPESYEGAHGEYRVSVCTTRAFSESAARRVLTDEEVGWCSVTGLDRALVKKVLSPERYEQCQAPRGRATVKVV